MAEDRYRWAEPGLDEVADGVFRCPLPLPGDALRAVNSYLLRGDRGWTFIDCGWDRPESRAGLEDAMTHLGSSLREVSTIFATHVHRDHLGAAGWIRSESGAWLTLGLGDRDTQLAFAGDPASARRSSLDRLHYCSAEDVAALLVEEARGRAEDSWVPPAPDIYLQGGELLLPGGFELQVLATPGHTRGHLCLFDSSRKLLFAGDHVLPQITPSLGVELPAGDSPLARFMESLELVRELPAELVLPAHGPTFQGLRGRVDELLDHHRARLNSCLEVVSGRGSTPRQVAEALPWTRRRKRFSELDPFNQMLAVFESEAHLLVLAERAQLVAEISDGSVRYLSAASGGRPTAGQ